MAARPVLIALFVACACSGLADAWPSWWRRTTTTEAPRFPAPEAFLTKVESLSNDVRHQVEKSQALLREAQQDDVKSKALAKADVDIAAWVAKSRKNLDQTAARYAHDGVAVGACVDRYNSDMLEIVAHLTPKAREMIDRNFKDVKATAEGASALLAAVDDVLLRAKAEVASATYGDNVEAILAAADKLQSDADWNNRHIAAVLHTLTFAADTTITLNAGASDSNTVESYAFFCMLSAARSLQ